MAWRAGVAAAQQVCGWCRCGHVTLLRRLPRAQGERYFYMYEGKRGADVLTFTEIYSLLRTAISVNINISFETFPSV